MNHDKRLSISWAEIDSDAKALANQLSAIGSWGQILAIPRGGLVPATLLAHHLKIAQVDALRPTDTAYPPGNNVINESEILIVDELVDTGATIQKIKQRYPNAHVATLYAKPAGRPMADSFVKEFPQDVWLDFPWERDSQSPTPL